MGNKLLNTLIIFKWCEILHISQKDEINVLSIDQTCFKHKALLAQSGEHFLLNLEILGSNSGHYHNVGGPARLKTTFELNPVTEGKQGTFSFYTHNFAFFKQGTTLA